MSYPRLVKQVNQNEIIYFNKFRKHLNKIPYNQFPRFELALRRSNFTYGRELDEDKVIDFAISIESLFSQENDSFDSIVYRLAIRLSRLVSRKFAERKNVFNDIKTFYKIRSKIIHGNSRDRQKNLEALDINKIESYIRTSLRIYITKLGKKQTDHNQLMEILDFGDNFDNRI